jgi:hypothetical protein
MPHYYVTSGIGWFLMPECRCHACLMQLSNGKNADAGTVFPGILVLLHLLASSTLSSHHV